MKKIFQFTCFCMVSFWTYGYGHGSTVHVEETPKFQELKKKLRQHDICKQEYFDIFAYNTRLSYELKGNCLAVINVYTGKNSFFRKKGKNLETLTLMALEEFERRKEHKGLSQIVQNYNQNMNKINNDGFMECGASELFAIRGIENTIGARLENVKDILNQDKSLDCFGKHLLDGCKSSKISLLFDYGKHSMDFRIQKVNDKCALTYKTPLAQPTKGTIDDIYTFSNSRYMKEHTAIETKHFEKTYGVKEQNRGTFAYFYVWMQTWFYYMASI